MTPITLLERCSGCGGFVPGKLTTCPHCGRACRSRLATRLRLRMLGGALGGGAIAFTLMACYGRPPCPESDAECYGPRRAPAPLPVATDAGSKGQGNDMPVAVPPPEGSK